MATKPIESKNPVVIAATTPAAPKAAVKQIYRDPVTRKAFVFFIDANTGTVLTNLDGYQLWEGGVPTTPGKPTPTPTAPTANKPTALEDMMAQERYLGRGEDKGGLFGSVQMSGFGDRFNNPPNADSGGAKEQQVTSETFPGGQGRITVTGDGPATPGTYEVNTPTQNNRMSPDTMSPSKTSGVQQGFTSKPTGFEFSSTPANPAQNSTSPTTPTGTGNLADYYGKTANQVPPDVWAGYIAQEASKRGLNPDKMVALAKAEGLNATGYKTENLRATSTLSYGQEQSYGAFQIHVGKTGKGVHYEPFLAATGFEVQDPSVAAEMARIQYAMELAVEEQGIEGPWVNSSKKPEVRAAGQTFISDPKKVGISVTKEIADLGMLPGQTNANPAQASSAAPARQDTGFGISAPTTDGRLPGSGAPAIQSESLYDRMGMTGVSTSNSITGGPSMPTAEPARQDITGLGNGALTAQGYTSGESFGQEQDPGYYSTGWGVADGFAPKSSGTQSVAPDLNNQRTLSGPIANEKSMSFGVDPTTGDEFAVSREMERQTAANFAQPAVSTRSLSGNISNQPMAANPTGFQSPVDYDQVSKGSVVVSASGLAYNDNKSMATTTGPADVVIGDIMPNGGGLHLSTNENVEFQIDVNNQKMAAVNKDPSDLKSAAMVNSVNGILGLQGKLMDGVKTSPVGLIGQMIGTLVTGGAKPVSAQEAKELMEQFGPQMRTDTEFEALDPTALQAQAKANQGIFEDDNTRVNPAEMQQLANSHYPDRVRSISQTGTPAMPAGLASGMGFGAMPPEAASEIEGYADQVGPGRGFGPQGPAISNIEGGVFTPASSAGPSPYSAYQMQQANDQLANSWSNPAQASTPPTVANLDAEISPNEYSYSRTNKDAAFDAPEKSFAQQVAELASSFFGGGTERTAAAAGAPAMGGRQTGGYYGVSGTRGDQSRGYAGTTGSFDSPSESRGGPGSGASPKDYSGIGGQDSPGEGRRSSGSPVGYSTGANDSYSDRVGAGRGFSSGGPNISVGTNKDGGASISMGSGNKLGDGWNAGTGTGNNPSNNNAGGYNYAQPSRTTSNPTTNNFSQPASYTSPNASKNYDQSPATRSAASNFQSRTVAETLAKQESTYANKDDAFNVSKEALDALTADELTAEIAKEIASDTAARAATSRTRAAAAAVTAQPKSTQKSSGGGGSGAKAQSEQYSGRPMGYNDARGFASRTGQSMGIVSRGDGTSGWAPDGQGLSPGAAGAGWTSNNPEKSYGGYGGGYDPTPN
jgi:hypothetical protein